MIPFPSKDKDNSEASTGLVFMRTYNKWHGEIKRRLKGIGITHPQFVVLTTLGYLAQFHYEITQVMIASMAGMDVMSVSQIFVLIEKKGWVERKPHSKDTRANSVFLTQAGLEKMVQALPIVEEVDVIFFGSLGHKEQDFRHYLDMLVKYKFE